MRIVGGDLLIVECWLCDSTKCTPLTAMVFPRHIFNFFLGALDFTELKRAFSNFKLSIEMFPRTEMDLFSYLILQDVLPFLLK